MPAACFLFCLLCGTLATLWSYMYGLSDHFEQLPLIFRAADPDYLSSDFFVNAGSTFGPRFYYARTMAWFGRVIPLPTLFLVLTLCVNAVNCLLSFRLARFLFGSSDRAGIVAAILVMSMRMPPMGWAQTVWATCMLPSVLVMPLVLYAVDACLRDRPIHVGVATGLASTIHPLFGLETGATLLLCLGLYRLLIKRERGIRPYWGLVMGGVAMLGLGLITLVPWVLAQAGRRIPAREFVQLVAHLRHPHHYLPSHVFKRTNSFRAMVFFGTAALAWAICRWKTGRWSPAIVLIPIVVCVTLVLCIGGYLFVEVWPSRLWTTAQTLRTLFVVQWLGVLLVAGGLSTFLSTSDTRPLGIVCLISVLNVCALFCVFVAAVFWMNRRRALPAIRWKGVILSIVWAVVWGCCWFRWGVARDYPLFILLSTAGMLLFAGHRRRCFGMSGLLAGLLALKMTMFPVAGVTDAGAYRWFSPRVTYAACRSAAADMARVVRRETPEDAVLLTPPGFGIVRALGRRAIVVDFKCFPFQDQAMCEWRDRMFACYGPTTEKGMSALRAFEQGYRSISDAKLRSLAQRYGASFAVLYRETATAMPVHHRNDAYTLVRLR